LKHPGSPNLLLNEAVVLFNHIVQVFHAPELAVLRHNPFFS
jgi:hypothetical protein